MKPMFCVLTALAKEVLTILSRRKSVATEMTIYRSFHSQCGFPFCKVVLL